MSDLPCRGCGNPVTASPDALLEPVAVVGGAEFRKSMRSWSDEQLARRGEAPLRDDEVVECRGCYAERRDRENEGREADYRFARELHADIRAGRAVVQSRVDAVLRSGNEQNAQMIRDALAVAAQAAKKPKRFRAEGGSPMPSENDR